MSDTKGQRCCEQGNFGELHDCAKGQPAESTASAFEEWWDENGIDYVPAGELGRPTAKELAQAGWQARGASEYERGRRDTFEKVRLYFQQSFMYDEKLTIERFCGFITKLAATSGTPAEHNPARAPHNKFASLWCDACPRPTSGTPAGVLLEKLDKALNKLHFMDSQGDGPLVYRKEVRKMIRKTLKAAAPATTPTPKRICGCGRHILEHGEFCDE